ncbi:MAG TPA: hypothetical protein VF021_09580, partial [Longimicrobiales bacterium]
MFPVRRSTSSASSCRRAYSAASWVLLALLLAGNSRASAQSLDLASFQDSIARIDDVAALRALLAERAGRPAEQSPVALTE